MADTITQMREEMEQADVRIKVINPEKWTSENGHPVLKKYPISEDDMFVVIASESSMRSMTVPSQACSRTGSRETAGSA